GSRDQAVRLWEAGTGAPLDTPLPHQGPIHAVAFSTDGKTLLTGSWDKTARLWDAATGEPKGQPLLPNDVVKRVAFSPNSPVAPAAGQHGAYLWDVDTRRLVALTHRDRVAAVAFRPDGKAVLTGSVDKTAQLWDVATGAKIGPPLEHQGMLNAVAFSPDG